MIKANLGLNVKSKAKRSVLTAMTALIALSPLFHSNYALSQVSEKDVQKMEKEEFGISGRPPQEAPQAPVETPKLEDVQPEAIEQKSNQIEAEEFPVKALRSSTSKRVWLFEDHTENRPKAGKVLLLKIGKEDVAAIRVLKGYPGKFAAKVVLPFQSPRVNQEYRSLKKLGDKIIALIKEREKNSKDLDAALTDEDLAKEVAPDDNELDRGIPTPKATPKPLPKTKSKPHSSNNKVEPLFSKEGDELDPDDIEVKDDNGPTEIISAKDGGFLEADNHVVTVQYASIRSIDRESKPANRSAYGFRYGYNLWRKFLFHKTTLQDMITPEIGLFNYSVNFSTPTESFNIFPLVFTVRYSLLVGESLTFFTYLGFIKNFVSVTEIKTTDSNIFATTKPAIGLGAMFRIGPSWAIRIDFGTELFAVGAVLKF